MIELPLRIIVPARNEALLIESMLRGLPPAVTRIVVVDDGSTDGTAAIAAAVADERIVVLKHPRSLGVGAAIKSGWRWILDQESVPGMAVVMAGDGQMDPADLDALCAPLRAETADCAWGNRLRTDASRIPPARRWAIRVLTALTRIAAGDRRLGDSQCGYFAIRDEALRRLDFELLWPRYGYPNDLAARLQRAGLRVAHLPVRAIYGAERSGIRAERDLPWIALLLLRALVLRFAWTRHGASPATLQVWAGRVAGAAALLHLLLSRELGPLPESLLLATAILGASLALGVPGSRPLRSVDREPRRTAFDLMEAQ